MTSFDRPATDAARRRSRNRARAAFFVLALVLIALAVAACASAVGADPTPSGAVATASAHASPAATPTPVPTPLKPAAPGSDPASFLAWAFTPIFMALFIILANAYSLTGNVVVAIIVLTLLIRLLTLRLSARQVISQQRMQKLQPELKALQARYKGDRAMQMQVQQEFFKERGVSPTAGCLPSLLQMGLLFPMYWVIRDGLTNYDPTAMWQPLGINLAPLMHCSNLVNGVPDPSKGPCFNTIWAGIDWSLPSVLFNLPLGFFVLGVSIIALVSAGLQVVQSRMIMPPPAENDPSASSQRSMMIFLPLISIIYGGFLPAGLFVYWIVTSLFSIIQQFLIVGWGSMFPLFGRTPAFAARYGPMFPVAMPEPKISGKSVAESRRKPDDRVASAASTVRPRPQRGRQGRRGRRR